MAEGARATAAGATDPAGATGPTPITRAYVPDVEAAVRMGVEPRLTAAGIAVRTGDSFTAAAAEVEAGIDDAEVVCVALGRVSAEAMDRAGNLRLIVKCGIGVDCIDVDAAAARGLPVLRMAGVNFAGVAEHVIGGSIAVLRRFAEMDQAIRAEAWSEQRRPWAGLVPALTGKTIGIVGLGSIGAAVARLAVAHGMTVIGADPHVPDDAVRELGIEPVAIEELLARADVVTVHAVLTDETHHLIDAAALRRMKPTAVLVNTARGPIVDELALAEALAADTIAGAVIDVLEHEPPAAGHPLFAQRNCVLTPHIAGCTDYGYQEIGALTAELIGRFGRGEPIPAGSVVVEAGGVRVARG
jgi:phosphoglycerate dehydrogenase-like enzyme